MDKRFDGPLDFLNAMRFGLSVANEARHVAYNGGDALARLAEGSRPLLARRAPAGK